MLRNRYSNPAFGVVGSRRLRPACAECAAAAWLAAMGMRHLAFGSHVLGIPRFAGHVAGGIVLAITSLIRVTDVLILLWVHGLDAGSTWFHIGAASWSQAPACT